MEDIGLFLGQEEIKGVGKYKYLGSVIVDSADTDKDIINRSRTGWLKWKEAQGVLCDNISVSVYGIFYKTVVRPAIPYGSES